MIREIKNGMPYAYITKNKQRVKQVGNTIYLNDGDEFEIEIYNPLQVNVLAKIIIQGNATGLSGSLSINNNIFSHSDGLVIRPGQRVFLERHLDDNKKFVFDTYEVSRSNETFNAIAKNGDVRIEFYTENQFIYNPTSVIANYGNINTYSGLGNGIPFPNGSNKTAGVNFSHTTGTIGLNTTTHTLYNSSVNYTSGIETGRVEKGGHSNQELTSVSSMSFSSSMLCSSIWKILPMSGKPTFAEDIKVYCTSCGTKRKKDSYQFCPNCGTKFNTRKETEIIYTDDIKYYYLPNDKVYFVETWNMSLDKFLEKHKNKLIVIHTPSLTPNQLRAIVID